MALSHFSPSVDPVSSLLTLQRELVRMFENPLGLDLGVSSRGVFPAVNIFSDKGGCVVRLEVSGVPPDQITIDTEYNIGNYLRRFTVSSDIDADHIQARMANGVLELELPKVESAKPRRIPVRGTLTHSGGAPTSPQRAEAGRASNRSRSVLSQAPIHAGPKRSTSARMTSVAIGRITV
jgi:HSP20 family molecular chaperone IbpA